jgi:hypothetical protein
VTRDEYAAATRSAMVVVLTRSVMNIISRVPLFGGGIFFAIISSVVQKIVTLAIQEGEFKAFSFFIDARTSHQGKDFDDAIVKKGGKLKQKKTSWKKLVLLFALAISGCATPVPKVPVCSEIEPDRAFCVNTITSEEFFWDNTHLWNGKSYWDARPGLLLIPSSSWVEIKKFIIEICAKTKQCDSQITGWERTVDKIDSGVAR